MLRIIYFLVTYMYSEINLPSENNLLIVKGRFKSEGQNLFGLFLLMFTDRTTISLFHVIVSSYSDMYEKEPHINWEEYEEYIVGKKWKGVYNNSMTASLVDAIQALSEDKKLMEILYDHIYDYDYDQMDAIIYDVINRIIHDKKLYMESIIQEISQEEYEAVREERDKNTEEEAQAVTTETSNKLKNIILRVDPIVAPVKGKPLYQLKVGDQVMVKIQPGKTENYYIDLYALKKEKSITPIPGTVVDIKSTSGKNEVIEILVEISPGIFGKFVEEERQVKLKIFDPATDQTIKQPKIREQAKGKDTETYSETNEGGNSLSILIMGGLFIMIILLLVALIMII